MKTLYVSDLDGTLLQRDATLSAASRDGINRMIDQGLLFTYATARGYLTASAVTSGLDIRLPKIVHNGAMIVEPDTGKVLRANFFDDGVTALLDDLLACDIYPIVYSFIGGAQRFSYVEKRCTPGVQRFIDERRNDFRMRPVEDARDLYMPDVYYITCIDDPVKLAPLYDRYRKRYHTVFAQDIYSSEHWLELMPQNASKANACMQLKQMLGCDRLVVFGDHTNDVDMFEIADESCAVCNAVDALKRMAKRVIASNSDDGVARYLAEHAVFPD